MEGELQKFNLAPQNRTPPLSLLRNVHSDGLSFGVIETVHRLNIHHHAQSEGHNQNQNERDKQARPYGGSCESYTVISVTKRIRMIGRIERLHLHLLTPLYKHLHSF